MLKEEDFVYQRLNSIIDDLENGNQAEFARRIGVRSGVIGDMFGKRRNKPSFDVLAKIASAYPQLRVDWLLLGRGEMLKSATLSKTSSIHSAQVGIGPRVADASNSHSPVEKLANKGTSASETILDEIREFLKQILIKKGLHRFNTAGSVSKDGNQPAQTLLSASTVTLPIFDQLQVDKRFLTELDRLLKAEVIFAYKDWAEAVDVNPNYVAAIEKGRYHFNIELLYKTVRLFPAFDFIYVVFGSAWSERPEPTEFPKRIRGPRPKVNTNFRERLEDIIIENGFTDTGMLPGDHNDLANDKEVYKLYTDEYGTIKKNDKYLHDIALIINSIINEIKADSDKG